VTRLRWTSLLALLAAFGCGHSEGFLTSSSGQSTPFAGGSDIRLTYNGDQDYWPAWTEDSAGVLYAFVPVGRADHDRCVGLIAPTGGTRSWELCDNQPGHADSTDSFTAFALGTDGRLLYQEVTAKIGAEVPTTRALWLADSARPFTRRKLLVLPIFLGGTSVDWLADLTWTGPADFIGLAQELVPVPHCPPHVCATDDSAFVGKFLVRGHIDAAGATLVPVSGTEGANSYALAEDGHSLVFSQRGGNQLYGVAATGGTSVLLGSVGNQNSITGIACRGAICVVTTNLLTVLPNQPGVFPSVDTPAGALYRFNISTGAATIRRSNAAAGNGAMYSSPLIAPNGTDVIVQSGGIAGHLQTATSALGDLYLYKGILP
jgi:hypothetical protein